MNLYLKCWKKYFDFSGRAGIAEFWTFILVNYAIIFVALFCAGLANGIAPSGESEQLSATTIGSTFIAILCFLFGLATMIPSITVAIRRLHDTNKTGLLILLAFIPVVGVLILIFLYVLPSTPGENTYGPPTTS